jgi:glycosyltransferase involved in cell wall biosynthesis
VSVSCASIIIPVTDQAARLAEVLAGLQALRGAGHELLVVDGGSRDSSMGVARRSADRALMSGRGQALQFNAGAEYASHEVLLFLPLEVDLAPEAMALAMANLQESGAAWGYFRVAGPSWLQGLAATLRSRLTQLACAEQGLFVRRTLFEQVRGFDQYPGLEDLAFSRKLLRHGVPARPAAVLRRRQPLGVPPTAQALRRWLRLAYLFGADVQQLSDRYLRQLEST